LMLSLFDYIIINLNFINMKKLNFIKQFVLGFFFIFGINSVNAQSDMVELLAAGKTDANLLIKDYSTPFLETFGNNLNNGWYSTAAPLKPGRFTITIGATSSFVSKDKQSFTINPAMYSHIGTSTNSPMSVPTIFGEKTSPVGLFAIYKKSNGTYVQKPIELKGTGVNISPLPVVQLSIGLIKGTEVMLRIFPKLEMGEYKAGYFGLGLKHNIKQWIPFMSKLPFELSFIGAYTSANIDIVGSNFLSADVSVYNPSPLDYANQSIKFSSEAWNTNLVISRKFSLLTLFGGVRLSHYKTKLDLNGNYPITVLNSADQEEILNMVDPIKIEGSGTHFGLNAGLRIKLGFLAIFAEGSYIPGGYSSATAGLNLGFFN